MENFDDISRQRLLQLARSPAGQQLMALLRSDHADTMNTVMQEASNGQMDQAKAALASLMADPKAMELLRKLQEAQNG